MIQTSFHDKIQVLKADNARDYFNSIVWEFLLREGMVHQSFCIDTPQQNEIAKRKNRHLVKVAKTLMFSTHVVKSFWGEVVLTTTYLINSMPSCVRSVWLAYHEVSSISSNSALRPTKNSQTQIFFDIILQDCNILKTFCLNALIVIKFLPQIFQHIGILRGCLISLFCRSSLNFYFIYLCCI